MERHVLRKFTRMFTSAWLAAAAVLMTCAAATAAGNAPPTLSAATTTERGQTATLSVNPRRAKHCRLVARGPAGRRQGRSLPGGRSYAVYLSIARNARGGTWVLQARCGGRRSQTARMTVAVGASDRRRAGSVLYVGTRTRKLGGSRPDGFSDPRPRQDGHGAPAIGLTGDGTGGAGDGGRAARAIEWAKAQLGRTDFKGWCLRFVAYAFGATHSYPTATIGANELGPRDGAKPATFAPSGSLVWFHWVDRRDGVNYGHVGISLGDGTMINAVGTVRIEPIDSRYWRVRYRGWTPAPAAWPGRAALPPADTATPATATTTTTPPATTTTTPPTTTTTPPVTPPPGGRKVIVVDNRATNGMAMRQDGTPLRLITKPWIHCGIRGCNINGTERTDGQTYDGAVCQTTGERTTNGNDSDPSDDANPDLFESTRYYGIRLADNTFGYANEVWIRKDFRGGLGLPAC